MDISQFEQITKLLEKISSAAAAQHSKILYDTAVAYFQNGELELSLATLGKVCEIGDPFYTPNSLLLMVETYKRLGDEAKEQECYRKIAALPPESQRFIKANTLGIIYVRLRDLNAARAAYLQAAKLSRGDIGVEANLAELSLLMGEFEDAVARADKITSSPAPKNIVIGRLIKGFGLWLIGRTSQAADEFRWLGRYLLSSGSIPPDFTWDFRDTRPVLDRITSREAQILVRLLTRAASFDEFRAKWTEYDPAPAKTA